MAQIQAADLLVGYEESGSGRPVVLVHGNWAERSWWRRLAAQNPGGYRLIACDLRGRGETVGPDHGYSIAELADDLWAFVTALGLTAVDLVGHSLGAAVVLEAARRAPQRCVSLTLIAPAWIDGMPDSYFSPERQRLLAGDRDLFARAIRAMAPGLSDEDLWSDLIERGYRQRLPATLGAQHALRAWQPGDALRTLGLPALVIGGGRDPLITPPVVERCADVLGVRPLLLETAGHSPNLETPALVWRALGPHLQRTAAAQSHP